MEQEEVYNGVMQQPDSNSDAVDIAAAIQLNKVSPAVELVVKRQERWLKILDLGNWLHALAGNKLTFKLE